MEWGKYKYDNLFKLLKVTNKLSKSDLHKNGNIPVYSSESTNNGIIGYTKQKPEFIIDSTSPIYVIFGDHSRNFNIATTDFCVADNVKVLSVNDIYSIRLVIYIISSWKKCIPNMWYSRHWSIAQEKLFDLPIKNWKIDFDFMESFIEELEKQKIEKLNNYLEVTWLKNHNLTSKEEKVLEDFESGKIEWGEFKIWNLFEIWTGSLLSNEELKSWSIPRISAKSDNNWIIDYFNTTENINARHFENFITVNFFGAEWWIFYHPYKASVEMKVHTLKIPKIDFNVKTWNFISTVLKIPLKWFGYWNQLSSSKLKELDYKISLPIKDNKPDYELMETLISAIQKTVIKDVVNYTDWKVN